MPQFIEVVRQHILGGVGNVRQCFVANLRVFPAMKEFLATFLSDWTSVL